uniref:Uncharacterized protein n=1 Tax=Anguilla anguilla TaxID=7936 RepID=A0A0E9S7E8_ANGAN
MDVLDEYEGLDKNFSPNVNVQKILTLVSGRRGPGLRPNPFL